MSTPGTHVFQSEGSDIIFIWVWFFFLLLHNNLVQTQQLTTTPIYLTISVGEEPGRAYLGPLLRISQDGQTCSSGGTHSPLPSSHGS